MNRFFVVLFSHGIGLAGVSASTQAATSTHIDPSRTPIEETPAWQFVAQAGENDICFGRSIALADLDGDNRRELVVAMPRCPWAPAGPGKIAVFAGEQPFFAQTPVYRTLVWDTATPRGRFEVHAANINHDRYDDLVIAGGDGVQIYLGDAQAARSNTFDPAFFIATATTQVTIVDLDRDGIDEIMVADVSRPQVQLWKMRRDQSDFELTRTLTGVGARSLGDVSFDRSADVAILQEDNKAAIYLGCPRFHLFPCKGGLSRWPVAIAPRHPLFAIDDLNRDGLVELVSHDPILSGRLWVHLSNWRDGGVSPRAHWSLLGDPMFQNFGGKGMKVGDLNGDGDAGDFVIAAAGRLYAYFDLQLNDHAIEPKWAWPRQDQPGLPFPKQVSLALRAAGDLDRDGFDDLVVAAGPDFAGVPNIDPGGAGRVMVLRGGFVPENPQTPPPFLPEPIACNLAPLSGLPDLTVDANLLIRSLDVQNAEFAEDSCEVHEGCVDAAGTRTLLRFSTATQNFGHGPAILPSPDEAPEIFEFDECHEHYHIHDFARYDLLDLAGNVVLQGHKEGFFLLDTQPYCTDAPPFTFYDPGQGLTPGWADIYSRDIPCQWIDITNLADATYILRVSIDHGDVVEEDDHLPNVVHVPFILANGQVQAL